MGVVTGRGEGKSGREMEGGLGIYKNERVRKVRKRLSPPALPGDRNTRLPGIAVDCAQIRLRTPDFRSRRTPGTVFNMLSRDLARHYYVITPRRHYLCARLFYSLSYPRCPRSPHTLSHLHGVQERGSPPPRPAGPPARLNLIFRTSSLSIYFCHCGEEQESHSSHLQLYHISIGMVDHPANPPSMCIPAPKQPSAQE